MKKYFTAILLIAIIAGGVVGVSRLNAKKREQEALEIYKRACESLEKEDFAQATTDLEDALSKTKAQKLKNDIYYRLINIYANDKNIEKSKELAGKIPEKSELYFEAKYEVAQLLLEEKKLDEAKKIFEEIQKNQSTREKASYGLASILYEEADSEEALKEPQAIFSALLKEVPEASFIQDLKFKLGDINYRLFLEGHPTEDFLIYQAKSGDVLYNLSNKFKVTIKLIQKLNRMKRPTLYPNRRLLIPKVKFSILVNKATHTLELYKDDEFFKIYKVRTGKDIWLTPVGEYKILTRVENPVWTDPKTGKKYAPGDPENELGTRWMAFLGGSIGIHGTIHPETIGKDTSNGCVGMLMEDVEELYDLVPVNTPLKIVSGKENFNKYEEVK